MPAATLVGRNLETFLALRRWRKKVPGSKGFLENLSPLVRTPSFRFLPAPSLTYSVCFQLLPQPYWPYS